MNKIIRKTLSEEVADKINEQIFRGDYKIGNKLPNESEMMESFGVGRSTIREAIKLLANSSIVEVRHGIGCFVTESTESREPINIRLDKADIKHLDEVRQWLEIKMASKAAENRTNNDLLQMEEALKQRKLFAEKNSLELCINADLSFHYSMATASGNPVLEDLYKATAKHLNTWYLDNYKDTSIMLETHQLHIDLLESITQKDEYQAVSVIKKIIKS